MKVGDEAMLRVPVHGNIKVRITEIEGDYITSRSCQDIISDVLRDTDGAPLYLVKCGYMYFQHKKNYSEILTIL